MIVMNSSLCSSEFNAAFAALENGNEIRRKCWPDGQHLKMQPSGLVGVVRQGRDFAPAWTGPSNDESDATDWEVVPNDPGKQPATTNATRDENNG